MPIGPFLRHLRDRTSRHHNPTLYDSSTVSSSFHAAPERLRRPYAHDASSFAHRGSPEECVSYHISPQITSARPPLLHLAPLSLPLRVQTDPHYRYSSGSNPSQTGCAEVVAALEECHARGFLWKVGGNCTDAKYRVNMCLRGLRLERTRQNRVEAMEKRKHIKKVWAEMDADKYTEAERAERFGGNKGDGL